MTRRELFASSMRIILQNQDKSGAYIASPTFPTYAYAWLRDGAFIAYGLLRAGAPQGKESAAAFLRWAARVIVERAERIEHAIDLAARGVFVPGAGLPTRYHLDGSDTRDDWPNYQIDGYGTWIWSLGEYARLAGDTALCSELAPAVALAARYVAALWRLPGYDCWEEHGDKLHPATLACVFGGLRAAAGLLQGRRGGAAEASERAASEVASFARSCLTPEGLIPKHIGADSVDSSLLWTAIPFGLFGTGEPPFQATMERIERELWRDGLKRYATDTYYGGGSWVLLTAWLGWCYAVSGRRSEAEECARWIEDHASVGGDLPEQVATQLIDPAYLPVWERRWGRSASPLLWAHAMYLVLAAAVSDAPVGAIGCG